MISTKCMKWYTIGHHPYGAATQGESGTRGKGKGKGKGKGMGKGKGVADKRNQRKAGREEPG